MRDFRRMHFVPRAYLRKFGFSDRGTYKIHMLAKSNFFSAIKIVGLSNICLTNEIYSIARPGEKNNPAVEHLFAKTFDREYPVIYKALVQDKVSNINYFDRYRIIAWITSMFLRNQQTNNYILQNFEKTFEESYYKAINVIGN
ncbi:DUF4238 domain-containing protein [Flavitalea sp.]|nr:DUF4238 domain-containing protein [Flavitalea sp.]